MSASVIISLLRHPVVTEKSNDLRDKLNRYVFRVRPEANKIEIRQAIETAFKVRVMAVRTLIVHGKVKRFRKGAGKAPNWKKAFVTVHEDDSIDLFEGI